MAMKPFSPAAAAILNRCISAIATSLANANVGIQAGPRRISSKELMTEAERILHKTSGGLSLFERLERDGALRD